MAITHNMLCSLFNFKTSTHIIKSEVMLYVINNHTHIDGIMKFEKHVPMSISVKLEEGVVEYVITYISSNEYDVSLFPNIYNSVVSNICANIDINNKRVYNKIFKQSLLNKLIDPHNVAFMTPQQINPLKWITELNKQQRIYDIANNIKVTDIYECPKCGDRKCTTMQMQTRSADEPATIFVTCITCYTTFISQ